MINKIDLTACTGIKKDPEVMANQILLFTPTRTWYLRCPDETAYNEWFLSLQVITSFHQNYEARSFSYLVERVVGCGLYLLNTVEIDTKVFKTSLMKFLTSVDATIMDAVQIQRDSESCLDALEPIAAAFAAYSASFDYFKTHLQILVDTLLKENCKVFSSDGVGNSNSAPSSLNKNRISSPNIRRSDIIQLSRSEIIRKCNNNENPHRASGEFHEDIFLIGQIIADRKETEEEETPQETILRLSKKIRRLFLKQIDAFQTSDKQEFAKCQKESTEASTKLWEVTNGLSNTLRTKDVIQKLIKAKSQFVSAWKDSIVLLRDRIENDDREETVALFKKKLPDIGKALNDSSQALSSLVSEVSHIIFVERELQKAVSLFNNPFPNITKNTIKTKLIDLVKVLVYECHQFCDTSFPPSRTEKLLMSLNKLYDLLKKIIDDCQNDAINLDGTPKQLFLDVTIQIHEFTGQLLSIIDTSIVQGKQAIPRLQISATIKRLFNVLEPLATYTPTEEIKKAKSSLIEKSSNSPWRKSTPLNTLRTTIESGVQRHSGIIKTDNENLEKKEVSMWEEEEEGNILYLSSNEAKVLEEEEKQNRSLNESGYLAVDHTKVIKAATLNKLIMKLTNESSVDVHFLKSFLATYRSFTTPEEFWKKIMERYNVPDPMTLGIKISEEDYQKNVVLPIRLRVSNVLVKWITSCWIDISDDLMKSVESFVNITLVRDNYIGLHEKLKTAIEKSNADKKLAESYLNSRYARQRSGRDRMNVMRQLAYSANQNETNPTTLIDYLSETQVMAEHLTMIEWKLYSSIRYVELLNQAWNKRELKHLSPNVLKLISRFNELAAWVASNILWQERLGQRAKVYSRFIYVAKHLFDINNFNGAMAVLSGLNNSAVYRLKFTEAELPKKDRQILSLLMDKLSNKHSYKEYRSILKNANPPTIPYLGVYLTDLTFIEDGNKNKINGLVNFHKRRLVYKVLAEIEQYQLKGYNFNIDPNLMMMLSQLNFAQDSELYAMSLLREPRNSERCDIR